LKWLFSYNPFAYACDVCCMYGIIDHLVMCRINQFVVGSSIFYRTQQKSENIVHVTLHNPEVILFFA
jgi:hypothetical protein